ncbi:MAG: siphovirus Gp157 family protein [Dolichospermum sp.]
MTTLHELTQEFINLQNILESLEGEEIPEELEATITEMLQQWDENKGKIDDKIDGYVSLIRQLNNDAEQLEAKAKRLRERAEAERKKAEYLKHRLYQFLELTGQNKLKTTRNTVSLRQASQAPLIVKCDAKLLPEEYQRVTVEPDKTAIKEAIKNGNKDVIKFAEYGAKSSYLSIR